MKRKQKKQESENKEDETAALMKQMGAYLTIPFVLAVSPILGWLIGQWLDKKLTTTPYLRYVFLLLGFAAGVREVYRMLKRFENED